MTGPEHAPDRGPQAGIAAEPAVVPAAGESAFAPGPVRALTAQHLLALQRSAGNRAVTQMLARDVRGAVFEANAGADLADDNVQTALVGLSQRQLRLGDLPTGPDKLLAKVRSKGGPNFELDVQQPKGGAPMAPPPVVVVGAVELKAGNALSASAHGTGGPGAGKSRLIAQNTGTGWTARVEVDKRLQQYDLVESLAHEMIELGELVRAHPAGGDAASLAGSMQAGVFAPGSRATAPTPHDRAAAQSLFALIADTAKTRTAIRGAQIRRALEAMGLLEVDNVEPKMAALAAMGFTDSLAVLRTRIAEVLLEDPAVAAARIGGTAPIAFNAERLAHQLFPKSKTGPMFISSGIEGGHITAPLVDFAARHPNIEIFDAAQKNAGGSTWHRFEQYFWNGALPKPVIPPGTRPTATPVPAAIPPSTKPVLPTDAWLRARVDKTTCDSLPAYMKAAEAAYRDVMTDLNANTALDKQQRKFGIDGVKPATGDGVQFGGFLELSGAVTTMFPFAGWFT